MKISNGLIGFTGRMERSAFRHRFVLLMFINFFSLGLSMDKHPTHLIPSVMLIVCVISGISIISMLVRRLRDINISPLWAIPLCFVNFLLLYIAGIVLCFKKGKYNE